MSSSQKHSTTICIVGAGPAGATASLFLAKHQVPHIIVDKSDFPRDKVCGDALTLEALHTLQLLDPNYVYEFQSQPDKFLPSWGLKASAPNGKELDLILPEDKLLYAPFYTVKRADFDNFLVEKLDRNFAQTFFGAKVTKIHRANGKAIIEFEQDKCTHQITADLVFGADGATSVVAKEMGDELKRKNLEHNDASVRAYFSGVTGFGEKNEIEFHFLKDLLPGYFWIFPMPNGLANVGAIVRSKDADRLRERFMEIVEQHPQFHSRFANAKLEGKLQGWTLPLNSAKKQLSGENYLLLGDAGSLIESFSGKGIGIAMISGRIAVEFALKAIEANDYSAQGLQAYHDAVYSRYKAEWLLSYKFQQWYQSSGFVNFLTGLYNTPPFRPATEYFLTKWVRKWMK